MKRVLLMDTPTLINMSTHSMEVLSAYFVFPQMPYGVLTLGSYLSQRGFDVRVVPIDAFLFRRGGDSRHHSGTPESILAFTYETRKALEGLVHSFKPDLVGISVTGVMKEYAAHLLIRIVRKCFPELPVAVGGHHATLNRLRLIDLPDPPDVVVAGEAERPLTAWLEGGMCRDRRIPGCVFRSNGSILDGGRAPLLRRENISYPLDYDLLWLPEGFGFRDIEHMTLCSRGCIGNCAFCTTSVFWEGKLRFKPVELVRGELEVLAEKDVEVVDVVDSNINTQKSYFRQLCEVTRQFPQLSFLAQTRVDHVNEPDVALMAASGFKWLDLGIESGDDEVLSTMEKRYRSADEARAAWKTIRDAGLVSGAYVMVGHPGSTYESDLHTYEWLQAGVEEGLLQNLVVNYFMPYDGARMEKNPEIRVVVGNTSEWTGRYPVLELTDGNGRVTYSREQMAEVFTKIVRLEKRAFSRRHPGVKGLW